MGVTIEEARADWVGVEFETAQYTIEEADLLDWATSVEEADPRFVDPTRDDFQAHPTYTASLTSFRMLPDGFPELGNGRGIDGGKAVTSLAPVRPGDVLTGHSLIADIYAKTGRSGTMIFIVHRVNFENQRGEHVSTVDSRIIRNSD